jgi:class 3 adenylate cyclase/ABC-type nitrate/sulfonate/bicarbonate transport system substrate-binding protein
LAGLVAGPCQALDKVSLQLKWLHQFQFAGYYAALQQGFYKDAGFEVEIREGGPGVDAMAAVHEGQADFGVCTTSVLLERAAPVVVLGVIFQHSPAVLLVPSRARIGSLADLKGRRLMDAPGSDDLAAMLKRAGVDYASLPRVAHNGDPLDLVKRQADVMVAYSTNEPFVLGRLGIPYETFSPRAIGLDFYGDNLCASPKQAAARPERMRAFLAASLKGWAHALAHKEQTVDLILERYSKMKSREVLLFEAAQSETLIQPKLIPLGSQTLQRWQSIANAYRDLGMLPDAQVPDGLMFQQGGGHFTAWLWSVLPWLAVLGIVLAVGWLSYRWISRPLEHALQKPGLSLIMAGLFVGLSIPVLIFILVFSYQRNSDAAMVTVREQAAKARQAAIENTEAMIRDTAGTLHMLATMAALEPGFFRTEPSRDLLYRAVRSAPEIDAAYVSFEDGYHRVVTRMDDDRRRSDPKIPASANWHSSYIDDFSAGEARRRHRLFFDTWGHLVGEYDVATTMDIRSLPGYAAARESEGLVVTEPTVNPDTGYPVLFVRVPIVHDGTFIGCATANITLDFLSQFLATHRASPHSTTIIADPTDGTVIAAPDKDEGVRMADGKLEVARLDTIADDDAREAYRLQSQTSQDDFVFRSSRDGRELIASFGRFPESFGRPWEAVVLTPTDDFTGELKATNRRIVMIIVVLTAMELLLIYVLSRRLSRPIEAISRELKAAESLSFDGHAARPSTVREIAQLQSAAALLRNSLQSFSSFAPIDVVRGLIKSGIPLSLGVEKRSMTILFSDLENFSTQAEQASPDDLMRRLSVYFDEVSRAISDEHGTVDKFIGDGIMAFWGAPQAEPDHPRLACRGALRAVRRMEKVNAGWTAEGKPTFRMRIGLNSAEVLVGNVGSTERFSYTVMGDGVNVSARLEGVNKQFGTSICISDSVFETLKAEIVARPLRKLRVKGRQQEFMVYELLGLRDADDPEVAVRHEDARLCEMTAEASAHLEAGRVAEATLAYRGILERFPGDRVAHSMLEAIAASEFA